MKAMKLFAAAAAVALPLQFAQAQNDTLNAQLVLPDVTGFSGGLGLALGYEVPTPDLHPNISIEGEFTTTLFNPDNSESAAGITIKEDLSYYTFAAYARYTHQLKPNLAVFGRAGLLYESVEVDFSCSGDAFFCSLVPTGSSSDTDIGLSGGIGINYTINPQMDFTAGFTIIEDDINHLSAGIKYKL